ncbi:hypothetical protein [Streptococcus gallinaceus]|uniref:Uncharacterized protein n=1 Tax=Streptococcus gallinaceus TaxID=165758 RepID=A0ABV2JJI2_9STRE
MKKQYATYPLNLRTLDQEQTYQLIKDSQITIGAFAKTHKSELIYTTYSI